MLWHEEGGSGEAWLTAATVCVPTHRQLARGCQKVVCDWQSCRWGITERGVLVSYAVNCLTLVTSLIPSHEGDRGRSDVLPHLFQEQKKKPR